MTDIFNIGFPYIMILPILLGLAFLGGLISLRRMVHQAGDERLQTRLAVPIGGMALSGLFITSLCGLILLCQLSGSLLTTTTLRQFDQVSCAETPLTDKYKIIVAQRRDGQTETSIADAKGQVEIIWLEKYSVAGNYLVGVSDGDYFWLNQETGGRRSFGSRTDFLASLNTLGVSQVPELLPAGNICKTRACTPCATKTPTP